MSSKYNKITGERKIKKKERRMENGDSNVNWQLVHLQSVSMCHRAFVGATRRKSAHILKHLTLCSLVFIGNCFVILNDMAHTRTTPSSVQFPSYCGSRGKSQFMFALSFPKRPCTVIVLPFNLDRRSL